MRVLITGATGFIGSRLCVIARESGWDVVAAGQVNNPIEQQRQLALQGAGVTTHVGSVLDANFAEAVTRDCDGVIHLAAAQHEMNVPDEHFRQVNVQGTRTLIDAAVANDVRRFVYGSTIGVYGSASSGRIDEQSPPAPDNIYGQTKLEAERLVTAQADRIEPVVIRISETYGPGDFRLLKLFRAIKRGRFLMIGAGMNKHQVVFVDDLSRGLMLGLTQPGAAGETIVLAGQEDLTTREMVSHVAQSVGRSPPGFRLPLWPFVPTAFAMEMTLRPLGIQPPLHRRRLDFFRKSFLFSTEKSRECLGFMPATRFAEGARLTAAWYAGQGLL